MVVAPTVAFRGTFAHTPSYGEFEMLRDKVVVVQGGRIARIADGAQEAAVLREFGLSEALLQRLKVGG